MLANRSAINEPRANEDVAFNPHYCRLHPAPGDIFLLGGIKSATQGGPTKNGGSAYRDFWQGASGLANVSGPPRRNQKAGGGDQSDGQEDGQEDR